MRCIWSSGMLAAAGLASTVPSTKPGESEDHSAQTTSAGTSTHSARCQA